MIPPWRKSQLQLDAEASAARWQAIGLDADRADWFEEQSDALQQEMLAEINEVIDAFRALVRR